MNTFKPGDLVVITAPSADAGQISGVKARCCCECSLFSEIFRGLSYYQLSAFPGICYRENVLKKIDGDRPRVETETEETRRAPVAA